MSMLCNDVQPSNAPHPIDSTLFGMSMLCKDYAVSKCTIFYFDYTFRNYYFFNVYIFYPPNSFLVFA